MRQSISQDDLRTLLREADAAARRLVRKLRLQSADLDDVRQDLLTDALACLPAFDVERGTLGGFAGLVMANRASRLARRIICRHCRSRRAGWFHRVRFKTNAVGPHRPCDVLDLLVGCVHYSGEKISGHMEYAKGAMGVHFVNVTIDGPPDPVKPNVLIYEPVGKELKLVAVEWLVPLTDKTKERPSLFGQPFMGPMEGHEPLIPSQYVHYDLHAWLFKNNPLGMFAPTNPDVSCKDSDFALLEAPTKMVHGP